MTINLQTLIQTLEEVVAEAGEDYVYPPDRPENTTNDSSTCWYVWDGQPDCIAGRALFQLGVPIEVLSQYEGEPANTIPSDLDEDAINALDTAQVYSDMHSPWGEILGIVKQEHLNNS
jgi:hypothetical protein